MLRPLGLAILITIAVVGCTSPAESDSAPEASGAAADAAPSSGGGGQRPEDLGDDDFMDGLADSCFSGVLGDCDYLYRVSAVGSDYEAYGATCGGRDLDATTPGGCDPSTPPSDIEVEPPPPVIAVPAAPPPTIYQEPLVFCHYYDPITGAGFTTPGPVTEAECLYDLNGTIVQ